MLMDVIIDKCKSHSSLTDIEYDTLAKVLNLIYGDYKEEDKDEVDYPMNLLNAIQGSDNSCIADEKSLKIISENLDYVFDNLMEAKEASILKLRCKSHYSLSEVAKIFDLTKERVRQIEVRALRKLRHPSRYNKIFNGHKLLDDIEEKNNVLTLKKNELSDLITESMNHIKILPLRFLKRLRDTRQCSRVLRFPKAWRKQERGQRRVGGKTDPRRRY